MNIAVLAPICWRTPPKHYGPWEQIASNITEGLVKEGVNVTLFASGDSLTSAKLASICPHPYEEDKSLDPKVWESLHISLLMEKACQFDLIHNHYDFLPLTYSSLVSTPMVTTIHGFSSPKIIPVYKKYDPSVHYVSISNSDRSPELTYIATVYNGIQTQHFDFQPIPGDYLLFFGRIHHDKGTWESIQIAKKARKKLIISGIIQDQNYFKEKVEPFLNNEDIIFLGPSGPVKRNKLLGEAQALLHPINFSEPFGLSVAEAMLCGTPVVAFNRGAMPELILQGKTGFLVHSVEEAVERIKEIPAINRQACRKWSESQFSQETMVKNYIQVYSDVLKVRKT